MEGEDSKVSWGQNLETVNAMLRNLGNRKAKESLSRSGTRSRLIHWWQVEGRQERRKARV